MNWIELKRDRAARRPGGAWIGSAAAALALTLLLAGCGHKPEAAAPPPPPEVGVITLTNESVALTTELPGRLDPVNVAQVRARVDGVVLHREFRQGAEVKAGDLLFQIDPAPFQAAYDSANASLAKAEASLTSAQQLSDRYEPLVKIHAVSKQDFDNAVSATAQARAEKLAAQAALETATINLGYTKVTSPINGRIGAALVTEGALVSQSAATEMAVVQQLDPIYFDFTESSTEGLKLRQALAAGQFKGIAPGEAKVTLLLEDGTTYPHPGKLLFSDIAVDPTTGMITLRAEFPNPDDLLLPGMFARARLEQAVDRNAITVPQRGVTYGSDGQPSVMVVTTNQVAEVRPVTVRSALGHRWIITSGLQAGERVILSGFQKVRPGAAVKPVPFAEETATNAPAPGSAAAKNK